MTSVCALCRQIISCPSVPATNPPADGQNREWALFGHAVGQHFDQHHKKVIQDLMAEWTPFGISLMGIKMLTRTTTTDPAFAERMTEARQKLHQVVDLAFGIKPEPVPGEGLGEMPPASRPRVAG